jgi:hypothetical protein
VHALEAEVASWTLRERELRRELAAIRAGGPDAPEPPPEPGSLAEGELRDAITAARSSGKARRPRWADDLLGPPEPKDEP